MKKLRVILVGAPGRMGRAIAELAAKENAEIISEIGRDETVPETAADAIVDFSVASVTSEICARARGRKLPLVIGTTGHTSEQRREIDEAAREIAIILSSNFSAGVNALFWLTEQAAKVLGDSFDLEIVETHHRLKKDAPSGTAKTLAEILQRARSDTALRHGREGSAAARERNEIGIHSFRGGDIVGEHTVIFAGEGERLELTHRASSRETFARGALRAARWVVGKSPGIYSMRDVLGL